MNEKLESIPINEPTDYFRVSFLKYFLMSMFTLGFYQRYWEYKNWKYIKARDESQIVPLGRAFFSPLWLYPLLTDIGENTPSRVLKSRWARSLLSVSYLGLNFLGNAPEPYVLITFFVFFPALPGAHALAQLGKNASPRPKEYSHSLKNWIVYILGGGLTVAATILIVLTLFVPIAVISGDDLSEGQLSFLREEQLLAPSEVPIFFYSFGMYSIEENGQFLTMNEVVSYTEFDGFRETYRATYADIADISVEWPTKWLDPTMITVLDIYGTEFYLALSTEEGGDKKFFRALSYHWEKAEKRNAPELFSSWTLMNTKSAMSLFESLSESFEVGFSETELDELEGALSDLQLYDLIQREFYVTGRGEASPLVIVLYLEEPELLEITFHGSQDLIDFLETELAHFDDTGT